MSLSDFPVGAIIYFICIAALLGLVMGSFCNAWAWRIVHKERISRGRSHCPECGHVLSALDLFPLISWLMLRGRCRYCHAPISARYPVTETVSMIMYITIFLRYGFTIDTIQFIILSSLLFTASLVDLDIMEIPDRMLVLASLASLLRLTHGLKVLPDMLIGFAAVSVPLLILVLIAERILKRPAMGGGDIKLIAVLGLHFGALKTLLILIIACIVGLIGAAAAGRLKGREFPFGPAIAIAAWVVMLIGDSVAAWYLGLLGL